MPYILMSVLLMLTGSCGSRRKPEPARANSSMIGPIQTNYMIPIPWLDGEVLRDPNLQEDKNAAPKAGGRVLQFHLADRPRHSRHGRRAPVDAHAAR